MADQVRIDPEVYTIVWPNGADFDPATLHDPSSLTGEVMAGAFEGALVARMVGEAVSREERIRVLDLSIQNLLRLFHRPMLAAGVELWARAANVDLAPDPPPWIHGPQKG